jgi:hypothetical protein
MTRHMAYMRERRYAQRALVEKNLKETDPL